MVCDLLKVAFRRPAVAPGREMESGVSQVHGGDEQVRLPYVPPSLVVLGTVQDLTRSGVTGQSDGLGFEELGGS
jgi:hypothetical protein